MSQQFPVSDWCRDGLFGARWEKMLAMNWESGSPKGTDAPRDTLRLASFGLLLQKWFMMTPECSYLKTSCSLLAPLRIWKIHPFIDDVSIFPAMDFCGFPMAPGQIYLLSGCLSVQRRISGRQWQYCLVVWNIWNMTFQQNWECHHPN